MVVKGGKNFYTGNGCACGVYNNFSVSPLRKYYKRYAYKSGIVPKAGDIVVWNCNVPGSGGCGHIAVVLSANRNGFLSFDQNWGGAYAHKVWHDYRWVHGFLRPLANIPKAKAPAKAKPVYYTVHRGDWLLRIAGKFRISLRKILSLNPKIKNPNRIDIGQKIRVK